MSRPSIVRSTRTQHELATRLRRLAHPTILLSLVIQGAIAIVPFALLPYYGRTLGVEGLGLLMVGQSFSLIIASLVDVGFHISATREVAINRNDPSRVNRILADVQSAKCLSAALVVAGALLLWPAIPMFRDDPLLFAMSLAFGVLQGMSLYWFFGGLQRQAFGAVLDLGAKVSAAIGIFLVVRTTEDAWKAQACFALAQAVWVVIAAVFAYRTARFVPFSFVGARRMLYIGRHIFGQHIIGIFYNASSAFLLGLVASPQAVGIFAGAEKLARAPLMPVAPFRQIFFPVMAERIAQGEREAKLLWRRMFALVVPGAFVCTILLYGFAEPIVQIMLGPGFPEAVVVLRILSPLPLVAACGEIIGTYWLLPNNKDALLTRIVAFVTVAHVLLMLRLGESLEALGGGLALLLSQGLSFGCLLFAMWKAHPNLLFSARPLKK